MVNCKFLGWITTPVYRKKPGITIATEIILVNRKLLGWTTNTGTTRKIEITSYNEDDACKPQIIRIN